MTGRLWFLLVLHNTWDQKPIAGYLDLNHVFCDYGNLKSLWNSENAAIKLNMGCAFPNNCAAMCLRGTLRRQHKEETDVWQTFSSLPERKALTRKWRKSTREKKQWFDSVQRIFLTKMWWSFGRRNWETWIISKKQDAEFQYWHKWNKKWISIRSGKKNWLNWLIYQRST